MSLRMKPGARPCFERISSQPEFAFTTSTSMPASIFPTAADFSSGSLYTRPGRIAAYGELELFCEISLGLSAVRGVVNDAFSKSGALGCKFVSPSRLNLREARAVGDFTT